MASLTPGMSLRGVIRVLYLSLVLLLVLLPTLLHSSGVQITSRPTGELTVFAAASLTEPFTEIGKRLEALYPGLKVIYNFGGSQALRTQLEQGARADVYASADAPQTELAQKSGVVQGEPRLFAQNKLAVIVPTANPGEVKTFRDLAKPGLKVVLAGQTVPVGNYSRQALNKANAEYGDDFAQRVLRNLVSEEENVKHVVAKVQLGEADAGMVYVSDVTPPVSKKEVLMIPIPDAYNRIATYPIALTQSVQNRVAAEVFLDFVRSPEGQAILKTHNFIPITK